MASIFISYRREDSAPDAGRLYDRLHTHFGAKHRVFRDLETLGPGDPFVDRIKQIVGSCDVLIAIIGKQWLTAVDDQGRVRLKNPDDLVRLEIQTALERNIRVIPTLVAGARMPGPQDLPSELAALASRNAFQIHDDSFAQNVSPTDRKLGRSGCRAETENDARTLGCSGRGRHPQGSRRNHLGPPPHPDDHLGRYYGRVFERGGGSGRSPVLPAQWSFV